MEQTNQTRTHGGFTVIELVLVLLISSFLIGGIKIGLKGLERMRFNAYLREVETGIVSAQQMASLTGENYTLYCASRGIYILRRGITLYHFPMARQVELLEDETTLRRGGFDGNPRSCAGSIALVHRGLKEKATFKIRVASGKLTLYKEPYRY